MGKSFKLYLFAKLTFFLQWFIFLTCFKTYKGEGLDEKPCVILFWHGKLALMPFAFRKFKYKDKKAYVIISKHKDGEFIAKVIEFHRLNSIRGSSFKGASLVLRNAFKVLDKKDDVVITPDGPRGPYHSIADGAVLLAQKKGIYIRILNYEASNYWQFKSWDKMILPKPFSKIVYSFSEPISILNLEKDEAKKLIQEKFAIISKQDSFNKEERCSFQ